ncbi:MAG: ArsR/SmtB family transcription factor [Candidatus Nanohaloarchaea archaeon]
MKNSRSQKEGSNYGETYGEIERSNDSQEVRNNGKGKGKQEQNSEKLDPDLIARKIGNRSTRKILAHLQNQDYVYSIAKDLDMSKSKVYYHLNKLKKYNLIEKKGIEDRRIFYQINSLGESVLERVNIPK